MVFNHSLQINIKIIVSFELNNEFTLLTEDEAVTDLLIKNGAKINEARDIDGNTPLFLAALNSKSTLPFWN